LEGHHGQSHEVWLKLADKPFDRLAHSRLDENEIRHRDTVMRIDISRE
jgi:hypothetical protein